MDEAKILQVLEAALLCAGQPLSTAQLHRMFADDNICVNEIQHQLSQLQSFWENRGLELVQVASGWQFRSKLDLQPYLAKLQVHRPLRYSRAVLETLAIIAWRQPVTRGDIEEIRGVTASSSVMRTLQEREWIEILGYRDSPGKPALWGTTKQFLDDLGLSSLDSLPDINQLQSDSGAEVLETLASHGSESTQSAVNRLSKNKQQSRGDE